MLTQGANLGDAMTFGEVELLYNKQNNSVTIKENDYDFEMNPINWNTAGGATYGIFRNFATKMGNIAAGPGTKFTIYFHGEVKLSKPFGQMPKNNTYNPYLFPPAF